ncbi:Homeodomain-like protein, partial [Mycena crocata]
STSFATMPAEYSSDLKARIVKLYLKDGHTMDEVAVIARVSIGLVSKTVNLYREFGQVSHPFRHRTGRPRTLDPGDLDYIEAIIEANPTLYLDEIQLKL